MKSQAELTDKEISDLNGKKLDNLLRMKGVSVKGAVAAKRAAL